MSKMREECKHGSLRRSCEICDMETLLKSSEEEMLFWRHAFREVNAAQIAAEERVEELEAEIEKLKAEQIDMLLHPEKYFSIYRNMANLIQNGGKIGGRERRICPYGCDTPNIARRALRDKED